MSLGLATEAERQVIADRLEHHRLGLGYAVEPSRGHGAAALEVLGFLHAVRGRVRLDEVTVDDIRAYYTAQAERVGRRAGRDYGPLMRESLRKQLRRTAALFELLLVDGELIRDPASAVAIADYLPVAVDSERVVPTEAEVACLYEAAELLGEGNYPARARALLSLVYGCGLRAKELSACVVGDVRFGESLVVVPSGKGGKRRVVPMGGGVAADLEAYMFGAERRGLLVEGGAGMSQAAVLINDRGAVMRGAVANRILGRLAKLAGVAVPVTCHVLRHAIATHLLERGATTEHLRRFLGHAHLDTTRVYLHVDTRQLGQVNASYDDGLTPAALALEVGADKAAKHER